MMERRKALTLQFNVNKDTLVPWTAIAGVKLRNHHSPHKNGSAVFDKIMSEINRRKPHLVLTDVLTTELGKNYMERIKQNRTQGNKGQMSSTRRESGRCREEPVTCRERRSSQREVNSDKNQTLTPKHNQRPTSPTPPRSRLKRRLQNVSDEEDKDKSKDIEEVIIGKDNGADCSKLAGVLDCGVSVSWKPAEDAESIKDKWTDAEKEQQQHSSQKRRKKESPGSQCNGSTSPRRHERESVLRLSGEDGRDAGPAAAHRSLRGREEDGVVENLEHNIVQFTVGGDDKTAILVPVVGPVNDAGDSAKQSQDATTKSTDPIVLSSDEDDESGNVPKHRRPSIHRQKDSVIQRQSSLEASVEQQKASSIQEIKVLQVVEEKPVRSFVIPAPRIDFSCMNLAFSSLYCGEYCGKANGDVMVGDQQIIIPLTDTTEQVDLMLTLERKELRRYSVWEQQEMVMRELFFQDGGDPFPEASLLFCVSQTGAAATQRQLCKLCAKPPPTTDPDKASPFILLTLRDPLEGMEGALLRSLLDIDCLNSLTQDPSAVTTSDDRFTYWEDINTPVLSLDNSIELIKRTGLDSHLLSMLGLETAEPELNTQEEEEVEEEEDEEEEEEEEAEEEEEEEEEDLNSEIEEKTLHNQLEVEPHKETVVELEAAPEQEAETQLKPEEDKKEQEVEHPTEEKKKEPTPAYTLCHRRTRGSYSVTLCKPDSGWAKFKHQGLPRRLIQFPPPPLKGGITVTMEDLQCLDNGQFLNDVIIDFYLKYLLQNVSTAVAERTHIFSSFFYKQLTRRDNASEGATSDSCQRQRRHQRVKTWTRHVDIFKKDFLFVPVNQEAHWYLVVICFPGLDEPKFEAWTSPASKATKNHSGTDESQDQEEAQGSESPNNNNNAETPSSINHSDKVDAATEKAPVESTKDPPPGRVNCTEKTFQKKAICKRPCILIMDSLKLSLHERVFKLLREYLQSEWEVRRGSTREFGPDQMKSSHCQVPLQDNSSDCGLYLLQYVESFLEDPVVHFDLPLHLQRWFPRQKVRRKRDEIRDLVLKLYRQQNLDKR